MLHGSCFEAHFLTIYWNTRTLYSVCVCVCLWCVCVCGVCVCVWCVCVCGVCVCVCVWCVCVCVGGVCVCVCVKGSPLQIRHLDPALYTISFIVFFKNLSHEYEYIRFFFLFPQWHNSPYWTRLFSLLRLPDHNETHQTQ